jgi:putative transposase
VLRLDVPPMLAKTLRSTDAIESMISVCRDHAKNVKRWRDDGPALVRGRDGPGQGSSGGSSVICTWPGCALEAEFSENPAVVGHTDEVTAA